MRGMVLCGGIEAWERLGFSISSPSRTSEACDRELVLDHHNSITTEESAAPACREFSWTPGFTW